MSTFDLVATNLSSPIVLAFLLGAVATLVKSDLKFPDALSTGLSIYLLLAIGLKGGVELSRANPGELLGPALAAIVLGAAIPLWCTPLLRRLGGFDLPNAAAIAAHYGSVSAVTFVAAIGFLESVPVAYEGFAPTLVALMEVPALVVALLLARAGGNGGDTGTALREVLTGKSIVLLVGGLAIGAVAGESGFAPVAPLFRDLFRGALTLFLLDLGSVAARRLGDLRRTGLFLALFAIVAPLVHGALGIVAGRAVGLTLGGAVVLAVLAASASYIAAPAAVRIALPQANPSYYLTASLGITFPFNLAIGIPLLYELARRLYE